MRVLPRNDMAAKDILDNSGSNRSLSIVHLLTIPEPLLSPDSKGKAAVLVVNLALASFYMSSLPSQSKNPSSPSTLPRLREQTEIVSTGDWPGRMLQ